MKFLYKPVNPWKVSQKFGDNRVCFKVGENGTTYKGKTNSQDCAEKYGDGWESVYRRMDGHNGLDVRVPRWTPCYAARDGEVMEVSTEENEGLGVVVTHEIKSETKATTYWKTRYWHFISVAPGIVAGKKVGTGELLGYCDSTGRSTGDHLHFDLKQLNGLKGSILNYGNGYFGAVNPTPHMYETFALDVSKLSKIVELLTKLVETLIRMIRLRFLR